MVTPSEEALSDTCEHGQRPVDCEECAEERLALIDEKYDDPRPWWQQ